MSAGKEDNCSGVIGGCGGIPYLSLISPSARRPVSAHQGVNGYAVGVANMGQATLITTTANNSSQTFYAALNNDLINAGQSTYDSVNSTVSGFTAGGGSSINGLNDGTTGGVSALGAFDTWDSDSGGFTRTFMLDTTVNDLGYQISQISSIAAWTTSRYAQPYTLTYSTVSAPGTFLPLAVVNYNPASLGSNNATLVTLTDTTGILATNVKALRFVFTDGGATVWREIDVQGVGLATPPPPAPEPSTALLLGLGVLGMSVVRRAKRKAECPRRNCEL